MKRKLKLGSEKKSKKDKEKLRAGSGRTSFLSASSSSVDNNGPNSSSFSASYTSSPSSSSSSSSTTSSGVLVVNSSNASPQQQQLFNSNGAFRRSSGNFEEKSKDKSSSSSTSLAPLLERLKHNDPTLLEIDSLALMRDSQLQGQDLVKLVSKCLILNTHLKKLDLSGYSMKDSQINSLAEAIKVNSTLEHLCLGWTGLGDDGAAVIAAALAQNEGLKSVDLRNNNLSHKAIRHLTNALRGNITLLDLKLSEVAPLAVDGDDIIINKDSSGIKRQEGQDLAELQAVVDSNRVLAKCFTGESVKAVLRGRGLSSVPSLILVVTTLVTLDLSHNRLTTVPRAIRQLSWLEHLKLNHNRIAKLPLEIGLLPAIKKIELQHNELVHLPATIALLETLEFLSVHHNRLRSISLSLVSLPRLKHVNFSHNPHLPVLRQYLHEHPILAAKSSQVVSSSTSPSSSSSAVGAAAADSDEEAEKEREEGGEVVPGANGMQILQESNQLSTRVYKIRLMCVGQANVGKTSLIDYLVRKSRSDGSTPPAPSSLAALYEYDDSSSTSSSSNSNNNNFQTSNPKSLKNFGKRYSDRNANLRDWSLKHKDKTNQKEAASPSSSPSSSSSIPASSPSASSSSQQQTSTPSPLYPYLNTNLATDGISIREWHSSITLSPNDKLSSSRKKTGPSLYNNNGNSEEVTVTFSSWDFAGQEIYYYTHLFFLSSRGIYLLCFNLLKPEEEVSRIEYWLQSIYTRGRGAPVILVGTHLDNKKCSKRYLDNLYATLLQKFSGTFKNIRFFFALSCSTGKGIEDLRKKVTELALSIIEQEREVPQPYITLEEKLRAISAVKPQPVLSWQEFEAVGATCGIPQPLVTKAAEYLHSLGSIVYFNEPASGLNDLVVLDCQWLTNVFADVISLKHNFVKDGILLKKDLPQIWKAPLYPQEVHSSLVALLEKFEVAYDIPLTGEEKDISAAAALQAVEKSRAGSNGGSGGGEVSSLLQGKILIPCLLPEDYPADLHKPGMWPKFLNEDKDLSLVTAANNSSSNNTTASTTPIIQLARYYAFEFMPFGFFNRIMVRLLRSDWVLKRCWKNGMFFVKNQDRLLLEMDPEVPYRLRLFMRGPAPAKQMLVLIASIETLVSDWLRVNVKVLIPCIHCIREHNTKPHLFTLAELEEAVANGQTVVNCRAVDTVSIYSLAPDVAMSELDRPTIPYSSFKFLERIAGNDFTEVWKAALAGPSPGKQQQQSQQQLNQKAKAITSSKPKASTNQAEEIVAVKKFFRKRPPSKNAALPDATTVEDDDMAANSNALAAFRDFRSEVWLMSGLEHPNIVRLKGFCTTPTLCMAMEYMECGTLHDYLHDRRNELDWNLRLKLAADIARGMAFLHSITPPIIHRDLKSPNVLLTWEDVPSSFDGQRRGRRLMAKIADFGLSRSLMLTDNLVGGTGDNPVWLAPEILAKKKYNESADVYSYGVILWEMLTRKHYFGELRFMSELEDKVLAGERPPIPTTLNVDERKGEGREEVCFPEFRELVQECWHAQPQHRPSFQAVLKRLSRIARKYDLEMPGPSGRLLLPSPSARLFSHPSASSLVDLSLPLLPLNDDEVQLQEKAKEREDMDESDVTATATATLLTESDMTDGTGSVSSLSSLAGSVTDIHKMQPTTKMDALELNVPSAVQREYIEDQQRIEGYQSLRQKKLIEQMRRQILDLTQQLKEAQRARSKAEQNLAFQRLENDRQATKMEKLILKVQKLKEELDAREKSDKPAPRQILHSLSRGTSSRNASSSSSPSSSPPSTPTSSSASTSSSSSRSTRAKEIKSRRQSLPPGSRLTHSQQLAALSTSPVNRKKNDRVKSMESLTPSADDVASTQIVAAIQKQQKRFSKKDKGKDKDYSNKKRASGLVVTVKEDGVPPITNFIPATQQQRELQERNVREIQARLQRRKFSKRILDRLAYFEKLQQEALETGNTSAPSSPPIRPRSSTSAENASSSSAVGRKALFSSSSDLSGSTGGVMAGSSSPGFKGSIQGLQNLAVTPSGVNQIFYGKEELIKLLLELDEFD